MPKTQAQPLEPKYFEVTINGVREKHAMLFNNYAIFFLEQKMDGRKTFYNILQASKDGAQVGAIELTYLLWAGLEGYEYERRERGDKDARLSISFDEVCRIMDAGGGASRMSEIIVLAYMVVFPDLDPDLVEQAMQEQKRIQAEAQDKVNDVLGKGEGEGDGDPTPS